MYTLSWLFSPTFLPSSEDLTFQMPDTTNCHAHNSAILLLYLFCFHIIIWSSKVSLRRIILVKTKVLSFPAIYLWPSKLGFSPKLPSRYMKNEAYRCHFTINQSAYKLHKTSAVSWTLDISEEIYNMVRTLSDTQSWSDDVNHFQPHINKYRITQYILKRV